jgi:hypothetical protein
MQFGNGGLYYILQGELHLYPYRPISHAVKWHKTKKYVQNFEQPLLHNTSTGVAKRQRDKETRLIGFQ